MENSNEKRICFCGARTLSLVIGWLQTVISVLQLLAILVFSFKIMGKVKPRTELNGNQRVSIVVIIIAIIATILIVMNIIGGIFLVVGVTQKNSKKIQVWKVLKIIILAVASTSAFISMLFGFVFEAFKLIVSILVFIFCLWVVGIHQQELEATSGTADDTDDLQNV